MPKLLEREAFRTWLESQPRNALVGFANTNCGCPLARYLRSTGLVHAQVGSDVYWPRRIRRPLPEWAQHFVQLIDGGHPEGSPVRVAACLSALERVDDLPLVTG